MVDLLQDSHPVVRAVADSCLDSVLDWEESWAVQIRNLKFEAANQEWLAVVQQRQSGGGGSRGSSRGQGSGVHGGAGSSGTGYHDGSIGGRAGQGASTDGWGNVGSAARRSGHQQQYDTECGGGYGEGRGLGGTGSISGKNAVAAGGQFMVFDVDDYTAGEDGSSNGDVGWAAGMTDAQKQQGVGYAY